MAAMTESSLTAEIVAETPPPDPEPPAPEPEPEPDPEPIPPGV